MARHRGPKKLPAQKKPPLTHFLCLPLVTSKTRVSLEESLKEFSEAETVTGLSTVEDAKTVHHAQQEDQLRVIHPKAIRPVGSLHLTLGVMSLNGDKLSEAIEYLNGEDVRNLITTMIDGSSGTIEKDSNPVSANNSSALERPISPPIIERPGGPLLVQLKGLESMHAAHKTSILYCAPSDETGRLYPFCLALQKHFKEKGFLVEDDRILKLHATIVNTIHARGRKRPRRHSSQRQAHDRNVNTSTSSEPPGETATPSGSAEGVDDGSQRHGLDASPPLKIDATAILEKYKDFVWADDVVLDRVAICEMGAKKIFDDDGREIGAEYTEVGTISLSG